MNLHSDEKIIDSWHKNASQWTSAVRNGRIGTRERVTNQAIVEAVLGHSPDAVLDIGCGEGWLCRQLAPHVMHLVGVDAVPELIEQAKAGGGGRFLVASYETLAELSFERLFDVVVCNFSLLGKESVEVLFRAVSAYLKPGGVFIVQTLHPVFASDMSYFDGWRDGSWAGIDASFNDPAPWYFRTLESWIALFLANGLEIKAIREPIDPHTHKPASILFTARTKPRAW